MANSKTEVQDAPDYVLKPLPFEDHSCLEKSIKAASLREQIVQFTYIESRACSTFGFNVGCATRNPYLYFAVYDSIVSILATAWKTLILTFTSCLIALKTLFSGLFLFKSIN